MKYFLALVSTVMLFSGCRKWQDFLDDYRNPPLASISCRLDSIYPIEPGIPSLDRTTAVGIHYNEKGNPIVLNYTFDHYGIYQFPVYYQYDEKDRLIEIVPMVDSTIPDYLNGRPRHVKYVYEGNSMLPVRDTIFLNDWQLGDEIQDLYYDASGRVNRVFRKYTLDSQYDLETKYQYDANGNKQVLLDFEGKTPTPLEYSDKPGLYSLHPVWRLIHKDYSKNSLKAPLKTLTEQGLPESLYYNVISGYFGYEVHDAANPFTLFLGVESGKELKYTYQCSGGNTK
jgi:hypothetical protein